MNDNDTPEPRPDNPTSEIPDSDLAPAAGSEVPGGTAETVAQPAADRPPADQPGAQQPAAGPVSPPPGQYSPPGADPYPGAGQQGAGYRQAGAYPPPGAYQQGGGYQQPGAYQQAGGYQQPGAYQQAGGYQQGGASAPGATGSTPPGGYSPPPTSPTPARRLTRSRPDRMIGGVCGGLARYWNTDPTLIRILTVVLTLATGGALLIGYIIAWIAIPDDPIGRPTGVGQPTDNVGYAAGGNPAYAEYTATEYVLPEPRERSYLGWLALSVAVLAAGVLGLLGFLLPATAGIWGVILAVALTVLGIGLLVGAKYGRARWLLWFAVPLAFVTFATVSATNFVRDNPDWDRWVAASDAGGWGGLTIGDRAWVVDPEDVAASPLEFRLTAGAAVLDLTALTALENGPSTEDATPTDLTIDAGVGVGELIILIPPDMEIDLDASVNVGEIDLPATDQVDGTDLDLETTIGTVADIDPAYSVTIDAAMGAGNLEVRREAA